MHLCSHANTHTKVQICIDPQITATETDVCRHTPTHMLHTHMHEQTDVRTNTDVTQWL